MSAFNSALAPDLIEDSWSTKTPMTYPRERLGVVAVDGKIYAIGGERTDLQVSYVGINERYDPETDKWVTLTSMPTPRTDFAIVAYQGKIYCIGGGTTDPALTGHLVWIRLNVNEVYDITTDSWSTKTPLPVSDAHIQAYVANEKIIVVTDVALYMYEPIKDSWTNITDTPTRGNSHIFSYGR